MIAPLAVGAGAYAVAFGAGVSSFLAPCVVPLMPAYVTYICGEPLTHLAADRRRFQEKLFSGALLYVAGFSLVFVPLGLAASSIGRGFRAHQHGIARLGGILVLLLGLQQLGAFRGLLRGRTLLPRIARVPGGGGALRPLLLGVVFGTAWTPCVGPILGAVLVLAASSASALSGAGLLFTYALGVGVPFLLVALAFVNFPGLLTPLSRRLGLIAKAAGAVLVVLGLLLATGAYSSLTSFLVRLSPKI